MMRAVILLVMVLVLHVDAGLPTHEDKGYCIASSMASFGCVLEYENRDRTCLNNNFYFYFDDCGKKCHMECSDHPDRNPRCEDDLSGCIMTRESKCDADCGEGEFVVKYICFTTSVGPPEVFQCPEYCCCVDCLFVGTPGWFPPYKNCTELGSNPNHDIACTELDYCCPVGMTAYSDIPGYCISAPSAFKRNFDEATADCGMIQSGPNHGYLLELTSEARHLLAEAQNVQLWFGARRSASGAQNDLMWQHSGGSAEADVASRWEDPDGQRGQICLNTNYIKLNPIRYADQDCDYNRRFMCEVEALPPACL